MPMPNYPDPDAIGLPQCRRSMPALRDEDVRRKRRPADADRERDRESTSSREKYRTSSRSSPVAKTSYRRRRSRSVDREKDRASPISVSSDKSAKIPGPVRKLSMIVPRMERQASGEVRQQSSYPSFSKAHSRETVTRRESAADVKSSPRTTDSTRLEEGPTGRRNSVPSTRPTTNQTPPSPPLTEGEPDAPQPLESRDSSSESRPKRTTAAVKIGQASAVKEARSQSSLRHDGRVGQSELSSMPGAFPEDDAPSTTGSYRRTESTTSQTRAASTLTDNTTDSDATSIAPERKQERLQASRGSPIKQPPPDSSGMPLNSKGLRSTTPPRENTHFAYSGRHTPSINVDKANASKWQSPAVAVPTPLTAKYTPSVVAQTPLAPPPPPPPPPAVSDFSEVPRVDYLLKYGGLTGPIPKRLVQSTASSPIQSYNIYQSPHLSGGAGPEEYSGIFSSLHKRLDDYLQVLQHNGSVAVATGYRSVARRLLDKLSQVFARDIASQRCDCVVCRTIPQPEFSDEEDSGISWGEILEFVSGRRELPQWPPFSMRPEGETIDLLASATAAPMQKLDIDVPEEYREHYIRQNQKTKRAVQSWLVSQPDLPTSPPEEADEDTLMFAMMTKLDAQQRNMFIALMHGQNSISDVRAPTPAERPTIASTVLRRTRKALQRLYRLDKAPRDCETALYLLNNPHLHGMLATLAEVNEAEWDILTSGRFDGFLWSGAETPFPASASQFSTPAISRVPSRGLGVQPLSRNATPFSGISGYTNSRTTTPFSGFGDDSPPRFPTRGPIAGAGAMGVSAPAPVQLDEETEIAVAAELERNLFLDMERLEDAFEALHGRAELVRQLLRERSAGLSAQAQLRRSGLNGLASDIIGVRLDTPASGITDIDPDDDDDGLGDTMSLAPDDSASQISSNRRHRHRRERRTPAPEPVVEEEAESVFEEYERARRERTGRRSKY